MYPFGPLKSILSLILSTPNVTHERNSLLTGTFARPFRKSTGKSSFWEELTTMDPMSLRSIHRTTIAGEATADFQTVDLAVVSPF
ncbi:unnamed protein product [Protopolystoma xenopodis]|uniref:Uncharacterized protein n=1 Tax=Protopolystoma xenopodis TaxID=117903 RepID=A0A3S5A4X6_9PLAT|nr:unnamed protein product [Protopolystoma xenopodis]